MKKYLSCVILVLLCVVCAMIFYVNANEIIPSDSDSDLSSDIGTSDIPTGGNTTEDIKISVIEKSGTFLSESLTSTGLRAEWAILKYENEKSLFLSCELYLDTESPISSACTGYLSVNGEKKEFTLASSMGKSTLLSSVTKSFEHERDLNITIEGYIDIDISTAGGVKLDCLTLNGTVLATEYYKNMPSSYLIDLEHISQYPDLPSGDEITSLAMVLKYLGYSADKCELCDLYLDKGPVGFTSFYEANVGNPRDTYNSYGCLAPVIVKSANRYIEVNGGSYKAYDLTSYNIDALLSEVASGVPVIVWTCEDFDITPSISRVWVVNGKNLYLKSNSATMVLIGYDLTKNTVTLANPAGSTFEIDLDLFALRYVQMGSLAVVVK